MKIFRVVSLCLLLPALTGCVDIISAAATGAAMTAEYVVSGASSKTLSFELGRIKKALLVALCRMKIFVDAAHVIEDGEEIIARADDLEIKIELNEITPSVTRITVVVGKNFLIRDKATAQEIVQQTTKIAENRVASRQP